MAQTGETKPKWFDTGVPNLDLVLGGGLQRHNSYIIAGPSGVGKSVLMQQIAFHRAHQGERVLLVTGLDEPHHNLLEHMATFSFPDFALIGPQIETVSMVPFLEQPTAEKINVLRSTVLNVRPQLVAIDGLRSFEAFAGGMEGTFQFLYGLTSWFAVEGITLLLSKSTEPNVEPESPEFSLVDGVLVLQRDSVDGRDLRRLRILKMRGQTPLGGLHAYAIDESGITVWPRPQATFRLEDRPRSEARMAFGVPTLDPMLGGGLPEATSTLLVGDPGRSQALLALAYLTNGVQDNQPGLWLGFRDTPSHLLAMSQRWGPHLREAESRGLVEFITMAPLELDPYPLAALLQSKIAETGVRRLVLDAPETLDNAFPSQRSAADFLAWLVQSLPQQGVSSLITQQLPRAAGRGFDAAGMPLASLAENVILVRRFEERGQFRHAIAILKMDRPGYDTAIREFALDQYGITVGDPLSSQSEHAVPRASAEPARGPV